ncbi:MAG: carboxypeptidase-like regulatory domain-containing protein, partial [Bacteroidota bacterium]
GKSKSKIIKDARFTLEDYELKSIKLNLRTTGNTIYKDSTFSIFAEGKDENDLTLPDATIELHALTQTVSKAHQTNTFIPDTLWSHRTSLEAIGETEIIFPDSVLPNADFNFKLLAELRNTENEYVKEQRSLEHVRRKELKASTRNDSIKIEFLIDGRPLNNTPGSLIIGLDTIETIFPEKIKLNQYVNNYGAIIEGQFYSVDWKDITPQIEVRSIRNKDSIRIQVENPAKLHFTYFIYKTNHLLKKGFTDHLVHTIKNPGKARYYFHMQYAWADQIITDDYEIEAEQKRIILTSDLPQRAYPGMKTTVTVIAMDERGKPVKDADITAQMLTKKFNYYPPDLESFQKSKKKFRHLINKFSLQQSTAEGIKRLNYQFWKSRIGLDSIEYYNFLYPNNEYYHHEILNSDSSTTLAPFVVKNGEIQKVKIAYIDQEPVYFAWNTLSDPYAFRVQPGYHQIKLRLNKSEIIVDSVHVSRGVKTILSIPHRVSQSVKIQVRKNELSEEEQKKVYRYIMPYRRLNTSIATFGYLRQGNRFFQLAPNTNYSGNLTGPVKARHAYLQTIDGYGLSIDYEPYFEYDFSPKLIKMRSFDHYPKQLSGLLPPQSIYDSPFTYERLEKLKQSYEEHQRLSSRAYNNPLSTELGKSTLQIEMSSEFKKSDVINTLLFKLDEVDFVRAYGSVPTSYYNLDRGLYKLIFFYNDRSYSYEDSLQVKQGGQHFHKIENLIINPPDKFSSTIDSLMNKISTQRQVYKGQKRRINQTYRQRYSYSGVGKFYGGVVTSSEDGLPLPGVNVIIKGTNYGTVTDISGNYNLFGPFNATLVFSFIGLTSEEIETGSGASIDLQMRPDIQQLSEVIVVGYSASHKRSLTAAVSSINALQGRVAGIRIVNGKVTKSPRFRFGGQRSAPEINIRGANSINSGIAPLIIVDGVPFEGDLDLDQIESMDVLNGESATAIYGSRAVDGVLIISTKGFKKADKVIVEEPLSLPRQNSIRTNFKDYALWKPQLRTNHNGEAKFELNLPDDITNWETHILAYGRVRRTGQLKLNTSSYLPVSGRLALPRFLIPGDSAIVIG